MFSGLRVAFANFQPTVTLFTDASNTGWGGYLSSGFSAAGAWSTQSAHKHINWLELKAIDNSINSLLPHIRNESLQIFSDNISSVYYVNKIGGTQSPSMCLLAMEIWYKLLENNISCQAFHIAGQSNSNADYLSRNLLHNDYSLSHSAFFEIVNLIPFSLNLDLFASRYSFKIKNFVSKEFDNLAYKINAFSFKWDSNLYIFPPIKLLPKVLKKFRADSVDDSIIVTPAWGSLSVLPLIFDLLIYFPIFVPSYHLEGNLPLRRPFNLMAWPVSSKSAKILDFRKRLALPSSIAFPPTHWPAMQGFGENFMIGSQGLAVPLKFLSL